jgi:hypothetical protein|tara:strand:- start:48 stop:260 length:213 start_codon:yes stop_codon:yes gene_type:complete
MANKLVIFVAPHIGTQIEGGQTILDIVNLEHCAEMGIPMDVQFEKNFSDRIECMKALKEKMIKIQEIFNE